MGQLQIWNHNGEIKILSGLRKLLVQIMWRYLISLVNSFIKKNKHLQKEIANWINASLKHKLNRVKFESGGLCN